MERIIKRQLQSGGSLTLESGKDLASQKSVKRETRRDEVKMERRHKRVETRRRRCGNCGGVGHNARTCEIETEVVSPGESE